jgi:excisionase family DNA binding protein
MAKPERPTLAESGEPSLPPMAYRPPQVAELLNVSPTTVFKWIRNGTLPTVKIAGVTLVPAAGLEEMLRTEKAD